MFKIIKKLLNRGYRWILNLNLEWRMLRMEEERIINPDLKNELEERLENSLRPASLDEYIGQDKVKENMKIYIEAAKKGENH